MFKPRTVCSSVLHCNLHGSLGWPLLSSNFTLALCTISGKMFWTAGKAANFCSSSTAGGVACPG